MSPALIVLPVFGMLGMAGLLATLAGTRGQFPVIRKGTASLMRRVQESGNSLLNLVAEYPAGPIWKHWNSIHMESRCNVDSTKPIRFGCMFPELDPFSKEITRFDRNLSSFIKCQGRDWVKCYHSKCRVVDAIKEKDIFTDIKCTFRDIIYQDDNKYTIGPPTQVGGDGVYELKESDHVKVECVGTWKEGYWSFPKNWTWSGNALGFRAVRLPPAPSGRERTPSVLILAFDSAGRHTFIRHMPKTWQMLKKIGATVMEGYNVVGEATREALMPILSGREWKIPQKSGKFDPDSLIFSKLKQDGYRTAFFEDRPDIGTFQYYFRGFSRQPTDHYLRALLMADWFDTEPAGYRKYKKKSYCLGDTPQFTVLINATQQFLEIGGKGFIFTFISDITHDDFNMISNADDDTAAFLHGLLSRTEDTLIVIMGDHGPRMTGARMISRQGKLEHLLPLLAIRLPDRLMRARPHAQRALEANARALTTPHDLHATILDVLDMTQHSNPYTVKGAAYPRGLTMLELISRNRTCLDAGIGPHYCACATWQNVSADDPMFHKSARALMDYINSLIATAGDLCEPRTLNSTLWVVQQTDSSQTAGRGALANKNYQVKIVTEPTGAMFEATMSYSAKDGNFTTDTEFISRINSYGDEPNCVRSSHPSINVFCFCRNFTSTTHQQINTWTDLSAGHIRTIPAGRFVRVSLAFE